MRLVITALSASRFEVPPDFGPRREHVFDVVELDFAAGRARAGFDRGGETLYVDRDGADVRELAAMLAVRPDVWDELHAMTAGGASAAFGRAYDDLERDARAAVDLFRRVH